MTSIVVPDQRIIVGVPATLSAEFVDQDGERITTPAGDVTVSVTDSAGADVIDPDIPTTAGSVVGTYTVAIPKVDEVDTLTAIWESDDSTVTTIVAVVGGYYFQLRDLAAMPDIDGNDRRYGPAKLLAARTWIENLIETTCGGTSFVERHRVDTLTTSAVGRDTGTGRHIKLTDPYARRLLSLSLDATPLDLDELVLTDGGFIGPTTGTFGPFLGTWTTATAAYVTGYSARCPETLRIAALSASRSRLISVDGQSGIPSRATSLSTPDGTFRMSQADQDDSPTGVPDVDAVITRWRDAVRIPGFG